MKKRIEMMGRKFGKLTVLSLEKDKGSGRHNHWLCICDCGKKCVKSSVSLRTGREPSCGCSAKEYQRKKHDLTGKKFGRLMVLEASESDKKRQIIWKCICDCGNEVFAIGNELRNKHKLSCGCLHKDILKINSFKHGHIIENNPSPTYISWASMHTRCKNSNAENFKHYGGRGISICERWKKFENFLQDMGERPQGKSLDRINPNGNYEKNNCKWSTQSEQVKNRR